MSATSSRRDDRRFSPRSCLVLGLGLVLSACSGSAGGDLEAQVLEIIRENPEVVIESVQAYQQAQQAQQSEAQNAAASELLADREAAIGDSPQLGAEDAAVVLYEFSDFQCPFCASAQPILKEFVENNSDRVSLVYKHTPLVQIHPQAVPAALASWAAMQQGKFWEYHDALFENQERLEEEPYLEIAEELGLDIDQFEADAASEAAAEAVQADITLASGLGVSGTPTFYMNGARLTGGLSLDILEEALDAAEAEAE